MAPRLIGAVLMSTAGAGLAVSLKRVSHTGLCILISFAAGALLAVSVLEIIPEAMEIAGWKAGIVSVISGYFVFSLLQRFVFHICPACAATHMEADFKAVTWTMVIALAVHSFIDGLAVTSGYLAASEAGLMILLAVSYHKFPEGLALALVARASGMGRAAAFLLSVLLEAVTTLAGGIVGSMTLKDAEPRWTGYVLGYVAGGFLYLVIHAVFSEVFKHHPQSTVLAAVGGVVSIGFIGFALGAF